MRAVLFTHARPHTHTHTRQKETFRTNAVFRFVIMLLGFPTVVCVCVCVCVRACGRAGGRAGVRACDRRGGRKGGRGGEGGREGGREGGKMDRGPPPPRASLPLSVIAAGASPIDFQLP